LQNAAHNINGGIMTIKEGSGSYYSNFIDRRIIHNYSALQNRAKVNSKKLMSVSITSSLTFFDNDCGVFRLAYSENEIVSAIKNTPVQ
jgi:hypothetical protein